MTMLNIQIDKQCIQHTWCKLWMHKVWLNHKQTDKVESVSENAQEHSTVIVHEELILITAWKDF